ncbi:hypothetical protein H920_15842 [Fukomys damarensis]|uniref:Secreted protein n=1 Tax=Fukomys damarensis TaxID=885580 RepID=A0A091CTK3_FUKDA|nr:hypothetical protein H920_15842 [Fukomys damarensis]
MCVLMSVLACVGVLERVWCMHWCVSVCVSVHVGWREYWCIWVKRLQGGTDHRLDPRDRKSKRSLLYMALGEDELDAAEGSRTDRSLRPISENRMSPAGARLPREASAVPPTELCFWVSESDSE